MTALHFAAHMNVVQWSLEKFFVRSIGNENAYIVKEVDLD